MKRRQSYHLVIKTYVSLENEIRDQIRDVAMRLKVYVGEKCQRRYYWDLYEPGGGVLEYVSNGHVL